MIIPQYIEYQDVLPLKEWIVEKDFDVEAKKVAVQQVT